MISISKLDVMKTTAYKLFRSEKRPPKNLYNSPGKTISKKKGNTRREMEKVRVYLVGFGF